MREKDSQNNRNKGSERGKPSREGRSERPQKSDRPDKIERKERPERTDKSKRPDRTNNPDRKETGSRSPKPLSKPEKLRGFTETRKFSGRESSENDERRERPGRSFERNERTTDRKEGAGPASLKKPYAFNPKGKYQPKTKKLEFDKKKTESQPGTRLNKYIANSGICSRREADEMIKAGVIEVDGKVVTELGSRVLEGQVVKYAGEKLRTEKPVYVLLNKPKDYITTMKDPEGRRTVMTLLRGVGNERIFPVGRLDRNTTGLLMFTNDGALAKKLSHPKHEFKKIYHVELDQNVKREHLDALLKGVELDDGFAKADAVDYANPANRKEVGVEIHSGRNRIVRRMFEHFDYKVKKLDRVYFAGLTKKDLPRGRWRHLTELELNMLKMMG